MSDNNKVFHMKGGSEEERHVAVCGLDISKKANQWMTDDPKRVTCPDCKKKLGLEEEKAPAKKA